MYSFIPYYKSDKGYHSKTHNCYINEFYIHKLDLNAILERLLKLHDMYLAIIH